MKRKVNLFQRIPQSLLDDGNDIRFWVDDEDLAQFADWMEEDPELVKEKRVLSGKEWNEFIIGNVYDDHQGTFLDEDCTVCGHLLVSPTWVGNLEPGTAPSTMKHCSSCDWRSPELLEQDRLEEIEANQPEPARLRLAGETLEDFCKRTGLDLIDLSTKKGGLPYTTTCVICKRTDIPAKDWFQTKDFAIVTFEHEGCSNGPSVAVSTRDVGLAGLT